MGYLSVLLHAHLPFVRHPDEPGPHRDDWFLEALVESYIPLVRSWLALLNEKVPFRLTLSLSPTLLTMLLDPFLQMRARHQLGQLQQLAEKELARTKDWPDVHAVVEMYRERFRAEERFFVEECNCDLTEPIKLLMREGRLEVITTAATHGFLPGLRTAPNVVRAQIMVALELYEEVFGGRPQGFWIPECAYYPKLDEELEREGLRYFITDSEAVLKGRPPPKYGVYAPVYCPSGVAAFARDQACSEQVWSSVIGYPGDYDYREFYRDIGYDLDEEYLALYLPADRSRKDTGLKYYRITGLGEYKRLYVREWALSKAATHAGHFMQSRIDQAEGLSRSMDRRPIIVAPYDAELFGHWWFEGPEWLDYVIRKIAFDQRAIELTTPSDYLDKYPTNQVVELCPSTWGRGSHSEVWVSGRNDYIYRHLHWGAKRMKALAESASSRNTLMQRAKRQAARELLLAQSSDWPFMMADDNTAKYGHARFREHMLNFVGLCGQIRTGHIEREQLIRLEQKDNIFPEIALAHFR